MSTLYLSASVMGKEITSALSRSNKINKKTDAVCKEIEHLTTSSEQVIGKLEEITKDTGGGKTSLEEISKVIAKNNGERDKNKAEKGGKEGSRKFVEHEELAFE